MKKFKSLVGTGVKLSALVLTSVITVEASAGERLKVIYGQDDRKDVAQVKSTFLKTLAKSTAAQIKWTDLSSQGSTYALNKETLEEQMNVCSDEKFSQQPATANCSGFLVGKDLLVTAGHCVPSQHQCDTYAWVFDYRSDKLDKDLPASSVYRCKKIVKTKLDHFTKEDYAIVQLDREVTDREPLKYRTSGKVSTGQDIVVIGHPSGLPTKVAGGATVQTNDHANFFKADLDTFGGNSGSAVFNATTGEVEGILVRGARDYVYDYSRGCLVVNNCDALDENSACFGEASSRIVGVGIPAAKFTLMFTKEFGSLGDKMSLPKLEEVLADNAVATATYGSLKENALMVAAKSKNADLVDLLLSETAVNVDAQNAEKDTALHLAIKANDYQAVKTLLEAGADFTIKGKEGKKAKRLAKRVKASKQIKKLLRKYDKWWKPGKA